MRVGKRIVCIGTYVGLAAWEWKFIPYTGTYVPTTNPNVVELIATEYIEYESKTYAKSTYYVGDRPFIIVEGER